MHGIFCLYYFYDIFPRLTPARGVMSNSENRSIEVQTSLEGWTFVLSFYVLNNGNSGNVYNKI